MFYLGINKVYTDRIWYLELNLFEFLNFTVNNIYYIIYYYIILYLLLYIFFLSTFLQNQIVQSIAVF